MTAANSLPKEPDCLAGWDRLYLNCTTFDILCTHSLVNTIIRDGRIDRDNQIRKLVIEKKGPLAKLRTHYRASEKCLVKPRDHSGMYANFVAVHYAILLDNADPLLNHCTIGEERL